MAGKPAKKLVWPQKTWPSPGIVDARKGVYDTTIS
jgi:hypothetical protein